jgi:hypothetical protein
MWCRDRLNPTAGEYCLGIRYLTSTSSHVVTEIQVIHSKLKLNGPLLFAGIIEFSLAILFFCGWTFLNKAVIWGFIIGGMFPFAYWLVAGMAFFLCGGYLLSGSRNALWAVPGIHLLLLADFYKSYPTWKNVWENASLPQALAFLLKTSSFFGIQWFGFWSLFLIAVIYLSRRHLVN